MSFVWIVGKGNLVKECSNLIKILSLHVLKTNAKGGFLHLFQNFFLKMMKISNGYMKGPFAEVTLMEVQVLKCVKEDKNLVAINVSRLKKCCK